MSNCFLQQCLLSANINDSCRSTTAPCYDYRTYDNTSFCAPGILCSILETCNNTNYSCSSPDFVCVVNSCCSQPTICIPIAWTNFCILGNDLFAIRERNSILLEDEKQMKIFALFLFLYLHNLINFSCSCFYDYHDNYHRNSLYQ